MTGFDATKIPTEDPQEALRFCRRLSGLDPDTSPAPTPDLSIVIPVLNEADTLPTLLERLLGVLTPMEQSFELVFVNDGSTDGTYSRLADMIRGDSRIRLVDLSRNFGHQTAVSAGLDYCRGKAVMVMDADLQDPPELIPQFVQTWQEGFDVVYAVRDTRKEGFLKVAAYRLFYRILRNMAHIDIPLDAGDFCIMDRRVVDVLCSMPERNRFVRGIRSWAGFKQKGLEYDREARHAGDSKYSFRKLVSLASDGILSFSYAPLRLATVTGFLISAFSFLLGAYFIIRRLMIGEAPQGFATLITSITFFSGVILLTLGVIGEYVGRIF